MSSATSKTSIAQAEHPPGSSNAHEQRSGSQSRRVRYLIFALGVLAAVGLALLLRGRGDGETSAASADIPHIDKSWYTTDDGKTWFADDKRRIPPFDHGGKPAVRCWVYTCDNGKTSFAGYLERFQPAAKKKLDALTSKTAGAAAAAPGEIEQLLTSGLEVKKPGGESWVLSASPSAIPIREPRCPLDPNKLPQLLIPPSKAP
jgi:hypothetical protein